MWAGIAAALSLIVDILTFTKDAEDYTERLKTILGKLDDLRKQQQRMVEEMRALFRQSNDLQIQLYVAQMNNEMKGYFGALRERVSEIPRLRSQKAKEENRSGLLALRDGATPHIYGLTAAGPIAFQGLVIGLGFIRSLYQALQQTAPDRITRMDYRVNEANALKSYSSEIERLIGPGDEESVMTRIAAINAAIAEKTRTVESIDKNPRDRAENSTQVVQGSQLCWRTITYDQVCHISGSIKDGWSDSTETVFVSNVVGNCEPREPRGGGPRGGAPAFLAGDAPIDGEIDSSIDDDEDKLREHVASLLLTSSSSPSVSASILTASHSTTQLLNNLSAEVRDLQMQCELLTGIGKVLNATVDSIATRRKQLPRV